MTVPKKKPLSPQISQLKGGEIGEPVIQVKIKSKKSKASREEDVGPVKRKSKERKAENSPRRRSASSKKNKRKIDKSENGTQTTGSLKKLTVRKKMNEKSSLLSGSNNSTSSAKKKASCTSCAVVKKLSKLKGFQTSYINHKRHENCFKDVIYPPIQDGNKSPSRAASPTPSKIGNNISKSRASSAGSKSGVTTVKPSFVRSPSIRKIHKPSSTTNHSITKTTSSRGSSRSVSPLAKTSDISKLSNSSKTSNPSKTSNVIVLNSQVMVTNNSSNICNTLTRRSSSKKNKQLSGEELLKIYKEQVERAIKDKKTFTVCGNYWAIRKALVSRGWIEKIVIHHTQSDKDNVRKLLNMTLNELVENVTDKNIGHVYKRVILSKMLGARHQVDLFWDYGSNAYHVTSDNVKLTLINNIRRGMYSYSTKNGLCELMKNSHWYNYPGVAYIRHPRSYSLAENGDPEEFVRDFKITAAMSLLKWIVFTSENSVSKVMSDAGKVPIKTFHFALKECDKFIQKFRHEDIDFMIQDAMELDWNHFLDSYYRCVHVGNHFKSCDLETEQSLVHKSKLMLSKMRKIWPYMDMDGYMNIWILKPTAGSRGIGIHICRTLAYVLRIVSERKTYKYIIQKYIERPLLIYNTKFDIRQWFLISSTSPLTIWMYKVCYLRFSSQTYNLRKLHESIHLTNNSVQCKYQNSNRDPALPEYNMWDSHKFKGYLEMIGYPNVFDEIIYPGMRQCITAAILIHQDYINTRKNSFELYGADFMLTEDFTPWLIEINSRPALHASTPITARMCPQVLEDVVKVIIDKARNPNANTGLFELLYKEKLHQLPPLDPAGLQLQGKPLPHEFFYTPLNDSSGSLHPEKLSSDIINISSTHTYMKYVSKQMKKTLENLLDIIHKERMRRQKLKTRRSYLTVQSGKIPIDLEKDSIQYVENINKVNDSIKEIQQILKPNFISDRKLHDLTATIERDELSTGKLSNKSSEVELAEICYSTPNVTKKIELNNNDTKYFLPTQTDEQLNKESAKIEEALNKINDSKSSMGYLIDFLKFLNVWGIKAAETMN